jgi:hypothetical protein
MKNVILFPFGGPKFLPPLLSSSASTAFWAPNLRGAVVRWSTRVVSTRCDFECVRTRFGVRTGSKSKVRPPSAFSHGHESIQGSEGASTRRDAETNMVVANE